MIIFLCGYVVGMLASMVILLTIDVQLSIRSPAWRCRVFGHDWVKWRTIRSDAPGDRRRCLCCEREQWRVALGWDTVFPKHRESPCTPTPSSFEEALAARAKPALELMSDAPRKMPR